MKTNQKPILINSIAFIIIMLLCFVFYGNILKNNYNLDDNYVIVNQPLTNQGIQAIPEIFSSYYINNSEEIHSYRPITLTTFAIEYEWFGANPFVSHLISILLYGLCCFLVFRFIIRLQLQKNPLVLALITTFIFLILPVHSEVVNNVKCRDELLCLIFSLASCIQFLKFVRKQSYLSLIFGLLLFALSLLSKISSLPLLVIIPLMIILFTEANKRKKTIFVFAGSMLTLLIGLRVAKKILIKGSTTLRETKFFENPLFDSSTYSFTDRIPVSISTFGEYIRLLTYPENLISYYGYNQVEIADWSYVSVWATLFLLLGVFFSIIIFWKSKSGLVFGLLWFCISISMFLNLVKPVVGIIGERFAFLPSVGFSLVVAYLFKYLFELNLFRKPVPKWSFYIIISLLTVFSFLKIKTRNSDWYDFRTLLENDVKVAKKSAKLNALLANDLFKEIRTEQDYRKRSKLTLQALKYYKQCLDVYPAYIKSWNNMGTLVLNEYSNYPLAIEYYKKALSYKPDYKDALFGAGYAYEAQENYIEALNYYGKLMALDPNHLGVARRVLEIQTR